MDIKDINKEKLAKEYCDNKYNGLKGEKNPNYIYTKTTYIDALNKASEHYKAIIEEDFKRFQETIQKHNILHKRNEEAVKLMKSDIDSLNKQLLEAKELLQSIVKRFGLVGTTAEEIKAFLKQ